MFLILPLLVALFCAWLCTINGFPKLGILVAGLIGLTSGFLTARDERMGK